MLLHRHVRHPFWYEASLSTLHSQAGIHWVSLIEHAAPCATCRLLHVQPFAATPRVAAHARHHQGCAGAGAVTDGHHPNAPHGTHGFKTIRQNPIVFQEHT